MFSFPSEFCVFYKVPFGTNMVFFDKYYDAEEFFEETVAYSDVESATLSVSSSDSISKVTIIDYVKE